jgi:hypothetical protein
MRTQTSATAGLLWVFGLMTLCVAWGAAMHTASYGAVQRTSLNLGVGIGMGLPVFFTTSLGGGLTYAITRNRTKALWAWTVLVLVAFAVLGVGAARVMRG